MGFLYDFSVLRVGVCVSPGQRGEKPASSIHSSLSRTRDRSLVIDKFHSDSEWLFFSQGSFARYNFLTVGFLPEWGPALLILLLSYLIRDYISAKQREIWIIRVWHLSALFHLQIFKQISTLQISYLFKLLLALVQPEVVESRYFKIILLK